MPRKTVDDRSPPPWEPEGEFHSIAELMDFVMASPSSRYSWTTPRPMMFDAKGRPCRTGADVLRAHDEGAFPIRWYARQPRRPAR